MNPSYDPNQIVPDGPYTAARVYQHLLKVLIAVSLYAGLRDLCHIPPLIAGLLASVGFMVVNTIKEWYWPSDVNEHSYSLTLRVDDFVCDLSCTIPALCLGLTAVLELWRWLLALGLFLIAFWAYLKTRPHARP